MILHLPPGSPPLVVAAADLALVLHIGGGGVGIVSGTAALLLRKGARWHRIAGNVFFASMLMMAIVGTIVAPLLPSPSSTVGGLLALYMVATGWACVKFRAGGFGPFEIGAIALALITVADGVFFGLQAANSPTGMVDGVPAQPLFVLAGIAALGAGLDMRVALSRGLVGAQRIARHLWRLCAALLIADGSFFLGQPKVFPAYLRGSPVLFAPELFVLGSLVFWLVRVRLGSRFRRGPQADARGREEMRQASQVLANS